MRGEAPLRGRAQEILHAIVRSYIQTGEPVGSRTISKVREDSLSAASVRNVMQDLAEDGYLAQPHTSAGRVPTEKAFRDYVGTLSAGRLPGGEVERMRSQLQQVQTIEDRVECSSHILTEITRNVGIAAALPGLSQELDQIELVRLSDRRVLMIVVTRDRMVRDRLIWLDEPVTSTELVSIRNYVNQNFAGWRLDDARRELLRRIAVDRALYDAALSKVSEFYQKGLLASDNEPEVHMEGASNLVAVDLHLTREKMRDLLQALEEKHRLIDLLDRFLETSTGHLEVRVGLEDMHPAMKELALIGFRVQVPGGLTAKIAVLGPMRMNYERVMSAVLHLGRTLEMLAVPEQ